MSNFTVRVQNEVFNHADEISKFSNDLSCGAIVSFIGLVREYGDSQNIVALELEHYPDMTELALNNIINEAKARWNISGASIIHRIGRLALGEQIVLVITASSHRKEAFYACEFLMDYLKTQATFWKKEITKDGKSNWVEAKNSDETALSRWKN